MKPLVLLVEELSVDFLVAGLEAAEHHLFQRDRRK
jgi:hypothetical protein